MIVLYTSPNLVCLTKFNDILVGLSTFLQFPSLHHQISPSKPTAYICGDNGIVLSGRYDKWEVIENSVTEEDLWSIAEYKDRIYFSSDMSPLYYLKDNSLAPVESFPVNLTTGFLHSNHDKLLSVGEADVLVYEKNLWQEIIIPPS